MSKLTAQQHYENTRGSNSPENREKRELAMFGHKGAKSKALGKKRERTPENHRMGKLLMDNGFTPKMYKDKKGESFKGWSK